MCRKTAISPSKLHSKMSMKLLGCVPMHIHIVFVLQVQGSICLVSINALTRVLAYPSLMGSAGRIALGLVLAMCMKMPQDFGLLSQGIKKQKVTG